MRTLLVVDVQNDFMPWGSLAVRGSDEIIGLINQLIEHFPHVIASQDWHPADHVSFALNHGKRPAETIEVHHRKQILWPVHCVQNTLGAELVHALKKDRIEKFFHKGVNPHIDSYSAFFDNEKKRATGLADYLKAKNLTELFLAGLTTDYCVRYSALDALSLGFSVTIIRDACRAVDLHEGDGEKALQEIKAKGAKIVLSSDILCL